MHYWWGKGNHSIVEMNEKKVYSTIFSATWFTYEPMRCYMDSVLIRDLIINTSLLMTISIIYSTKSAVPYGTLHGFLIICDGLSCGSAKSS